MPMNMNDYQAAAMQTKIYKDEDALLYNALNLSGEAGEVASKYAKALRDGTNLDVLEVAKELGDCLWNIAGMAEAMGLSLEQVAALNLQKLQKREEDGTLTGSGDNR